MCGGGPGRLRPRPDLGDWQRGLLWGLVLAWLVLTFLRLPWVWRPHVQEVLRFLDRPPREATRLTFGTEWVELLEVLKREAEPGEIVRLLRDPGQEPYAFYLLVHQGYPRRVRWVSEWSQVAPGELLFTNLGEGMPEGFRLLAASPLGRLLRRE